MKRSLGKLELKKTRIANLNEDELDSVRGGTTPALSALAASSWQCVGGSIAAATATIGAYSVGQEQSWWNCPTQQGNSDKFATNPDGTMGCLLEPAYVYGVGGQ